ncbi:MAG: hypothetical protein LBP56_04625 [Odoribacteraceae bacterium]|jgi:hypothetical protein|nr:hypothetical protein [Odoribacteraceae bacterium]
MRKYYFIALLLGTILVACYEDKGNYTYHDTLEAVIEVEERYTVLRFDTLRISPEISTLHGDDTYDYLWILYRMNELVDTIGREKELVYPMIRTSDQYRIVLAVTSRSTGISYWRYIDLAVTSRESRGWYVFKNIDGHADADFFLDSGEDVIPNFLESTHGYYMKGEARRLSFLSEYQDYVDYQDPSRGCTWAVRMFFISDQDILVYDPVEAAVTRDALELFYRYPDVLNTHAIFGAVDEAYILANGTLYDMPLMLVSSGRFGSPRKLQDGRECKLSPYAGVLPESTTSPLLFDELSRTFLLKYMYIVALSPHDNPILRDMPYNLVFMGTKFTKPMNYGRAYALMQHDADRSWKIFGIQIGDGETEDVTEYAVPDTSGLITAPFRAQHARLDIVYYTRENRIIAYNILDGRETVVHEIPADEQFTMLKCEFDVSRSQSQWKVPAHLLVFATNKGEEYTLSLYYTNENTGLLAGKYKHFRGKGRPVDVKHGSPDGAATVNI